MSCPTCGCEAHTPPRTWPVHCSVCKQDKWPYTVVVPDPFVCSKCRITSPQKREAARAAAKKSVRSRSQKATSADPSSPGGTLNPGDIKGRPCGA